MRWNQKGSGAIEVSAIKGHIKRHLKICILVCFSRIKMSYHSNNILHMFYFVRLKIQTSQHEVKFWRTEKPKRRGFYDILVSYGKDVIIKHYLY